MMRKKHGFSLVEMLVVIVLMGVVLLIGVPSYLNWYKQQQFIEVVTQTRNIFRIAQFSALSSGRWNLVVIHKNCPAGLDLPTDRFCIRRFRLPVDECGIKTGSIPPGTNVRACIDAKTPGPTVLCEYIRDRWSYGMNIPLYSYLDNTRMYSISPNGWIFYHDNQKINDPSQDCRIGANPNSPIQLLFSNNNERILRFAFPTRPLYQAVCLMGYGNVTTTKATKTLSNLFCP